MNPRSIVIISLLGILINIYAQQTSNCCTPQGGRRGCDNSTVVDYISSLPDLSNCKNSWFEACAETVYRELDFCVVVCGDGLCATKSGESCSSCPADCGSCVATQSCTPISDDIFKAWSVPTSSNDTTNIFVDPLFAQQWHIRNTGQTQFSFKATPGHDINVLPVYKEYQIFGAGVVVGIVDDGVEWRHPDLQCGYQPQLSRDVDLEIDFQQPGVFDGHGTCCAGICCGQGNNSACGIGVAFKSKNTGIRVLGNSFSDAKCAEALAFKHTEIDIYSNSWGPSDDGATIERYPLALAAIEKGIKEGRDGRGAIYVWAAGNGYNRGDGSNYDELANSPYTICIGASDWNGIYSTYSEPGTNILANTPSSTRGYDKPSNSWKYYSTMVTADRMGFPGYNSRSGNDGNCAFDFGGTSASCPLAAGILALLLEANQMLTWRDVQWIIVKTSTRTDLQHESWQVNGAGHYFSKHYGFGRLDAYKAVSTALKWAPVCDNFTSFSRKVGLTVDSVGITSPGIEIPKNISAPLTLSFSFDNLPEMVIEHISIAVSATAKRRGQLVFGISSPSGTVSVVSDGRNNDFGANYDKQVFTTVQMWEEKSHGVWTFAIYDNNRDKASADIPSILTEVVITLHGARVDCALGSEIATNPSTSVSPSTTPLTDWVSIRIRNIVAVALFSAMSLIIVVIVLISVFKMQRSAETELNSDIWKEMIEDDTATDKKADEEGVQDE